MQHFVFTVEMRDKISKKRIERIKQGYKNNPSKIQVHFNNTIITCDSKLEVAILEYLRALGETSLERNFEIVEYKMDGSIHRFIPDFLTNHFIVEVKSVVGKSLSDKWHDYKNQIPFKKEALEKLATRIGKKALWLDKSNKDIRRIYKDFFGKSIVSYDLK